VQDVAGHFIERLACEHVDQPSDVYKISVL
jgi:hypothetical protein